MKRASVDFIIYFENIYQSTILHSTNMQSSQRRTVLITGANKGIGYATIEKLLSEPTPYDIILTSRDVTLGEKATATLQEKYPNSSSTVTYHQLDQNDDKSVENLVEWIKSSNKKIDVLVNNAAVRQSTTDDEYKKLIVKTNFVSVVNLTEKLLPYLTEDGKILQITSLVGQLAWQGETLRKALTDPELTREKLFELANNIVEVTKDFPYNPPFFAESSYPASKALSNTYTRNFLLGQLKENQQVYVVEPGWVQTDMGGTRAPLTPEQGVDSIWYVINLPFKKDPELNCKLISLRKAVEF